MKYAVFFLLLSAAVCLADPTEEQYQLNYKFTGLSNQLESLANLIVGKGGAVDWKNIVTYELAIKDVMKNQNPDATKIIEENMKNLVGEYQRLFDVYRELSFGDKKK